MSGQLTNEQMYPFLQQRLERIESKLDFMLRQSARKESVPLAPKAYSALAQAGMDPRKLSVHKVVTLLDEWKAEQAEKDTNEVARDPMSGKVLRHCDTPMTYVIKGGAGYAQCSVCDYRVGIIKEDGDEQG